MNKDIRSYASNPDLEEIRGAIQGEFKPLFPELDHPAEKVTADAQPVAVDFPERVIDVIWQGAGLTTYHEDGDQKQKFYAFARAVVSETLARLPATTEKVTADAVDERAAFEAWIRTGELDLTPRLERDGEFYDDFDTQRAWRGWQARAALSAQPSDAAAEAQSAAPAPSVEQDERGAFAQAAIRMLEGYAESYESMSRMDGGGNKVQCSSVAFDIRHNMVGWIKARAASTSANVAQGAEAVILKGVGKMNGDGWKDTTKVDEVVFVWNAELPRPYSPGQYPRIGNECGWTASTDQYNFSPATLEEARSAIEGMLAALPAQTALTKNNNPATQKIIERWLQDDQPAQTTLTAAQKWEIAERVHAQCERLKPHATFRSAASQAINDTLDALTAAQSASGDTK